MSSDVYFYNVGNDFWNIYNRTEGGDAAATHPVGYGMQDVARPFGFGATTDIELPGEAPGRIPTWPSTS